MWRAPPALTPTFLGRSWGTTGVRASRLPRHGDPSGMRAPATTRTIATWTARFTTSTTGGRAPSRRGPRYRTHAREFGCDSDRSLSALSVAALPDLGAVVGVADQE